MFNGSIPVKVITKKCPHKSIKAYRCYEKTSLHPENVAGHLISDVDVYPVPKKEPNLEAATMKKEQEAAKSNPVHEFSLTLNNYTIS